MKIAASVLSWVGGLVTAVLTLIFLGSIVPAFVTLTIIYLAVVVLCIRGTLMASGKKILAGVLTFVFASPVGGVLTFFVPDEEKKGVELAQKKNTALILSWLGVIYASLIVFLYLKDVIPSVALVIIIIVMYAGVYSRTPLVGYGYKLPAGIITIACGSVVGGVLTLLLPIEPKAKSVKAQKKTEEEDEKLKAIFSDNDLIRFEHLCEYFDIPVGSFETKKLKAVEDVTLSIKEGETLGVVGESGCGKTTLGRTLMYLYKPTSGKIFYKGKEIKGKRDIKNFRLKTTMVFQDPYSSLNPRMTVEDIIGEPLDVHKLYKTKEERRKKVRHLMELVGLPEEHATRYPHEFSGGQRQRIGIARALAVEPEFIICDEPVSALDVSIQAQVINMFEDLQKKLDLTLMFIAHDILVVRHISDRIAVMYLGRLVELSSSNEVCDNPLHPYTVTLMSAVPMPDPKTARESQRIILSGDIPSPLNAPSGCPFRTRCPIASEECAASVPPLKEVEPGHFVACFKHGQLKPVSSDEKNKA